VTRPLIGLPGRRKTGAQLIDWPAALADLEMDVYIADYSRAVLVAGGLPLHIPPDVAPADVLPALDGLLLTGGADLDPALYDEESETDDFPPEPERDAFELALLKGAGALDLPVLGICRGLQLVNVAAGGSLHQHVEAHAGFDRPPATELHHVQFAADTQLHGMYGARRSVNSLHHQTVKELGAELIVAAMADDGTIEGIEHPDLPVIAVQWHPEMMNGAAEDPIFAWLVDAATQRTTSQS